MEYTEEHVDHMCKCISTMHVCQSVVCESIVGRYMIDSLNFDTLWRWSVEINRISTLYAVLTSVTCIVQSSMIDRLQSVHGPHIIDIGYINVCQRV
jgi:hypothetical protein